MVDFPVTSFCSFRNFHRDERKILGWAKYSLCFIDTAMLIHFLSAAGAFLESKHILENTPLYQRRFVTSLCLGTMHAFIFLSFFMTYCCVKDAVTLVRTRLALLLCAGFANFIFLLTVFTLMIYYGGTDHPFKEFAVNLDEKTDIAWISILMLSAMSVFLSLLSGALALCFFRNLEKLSSIINPFNTYVNITPESPYSTHWKPSRRFPNHADFPRSPFRELYPHRALIAASPGSKKTSPRHEAFIHELKTALPSRNDQRRTVL